MCVFPVLNVRFQRSKNWLIRKHLTFNFCENLRDSRKGIQTTKFRVPENVGIENSASPLSKR